MRLAYDTQVKSTAAPADTATPAIMGPQFAEYNDVLKKFPSGTSVNIRGKVVKVDPAKKTTTGMSRLLIEIMDKK